VRSRGRRPRPSEDLPDLPVPAEVEGLAARETLREAVPGTALSRRAIGLVLGTGIITTVTITFMTWFMSPTTIAPGLVGYVWIEALGIEGLKD
ncbi:MAG TPA: hypothetical protein VFJ02_01080, partial [Vicinamibacterales bacterium]|nr:hypothetical protein [Vicinamibacterales bacterium]